MAGGALARAFKELRLNAGLSLVQLGNRTGLSPETLGEWENGKVIPRSSSLLRVNRTFPIGALYNAHVEWIRSRRCPWVPDDGGRRKAGYTPDNVNDCVPRAIALATEIPYAEVYHELRRRDPRKVIDRTGVKTRVMSAYLETIGWKPLSLESYKVTLEAGAFPNGKLLIQSTISLQAHNVHFHALINGTIYDTWDSSIFGANDTMGRRVLNVWVPEESTLRASELRDRYMATLALALERGW